MSMTTLKKWVLLFLKIMNNLELKNVTLVAVSSIKIKETINALVSSMKNISYGEVIFITHERPLNLPDGITFIKCDKITNINMYSEFMAYELHKYISTDFALTVQYDGYVLNPNGWSTDFLNFDYIGAPWPKRFTPHLSDGTPVRVGNGGFSFRSKRLLNILNELNLPFTDNGTGFYNEDGVLCVYYRKELERAGIKFAPVDIAAKFSHELDCKESVKNPFGFHESKIVFPYFLWPIKSILKKIGLNL